MDGVLVKLNTVLFCSHILVKFSLAVQYIPGSILGRASGFLGPILFCTRMAHYSSGKAGWFSAWTLSFHQCSYNSGCMWIWLAVSIPALVVFLLALQFPPTLKNLNPFIFLVHSFWPLVVCTKTCLAAYVCVAAVTLRHFENPVSWYAACYRNC